MDKHLQGWLVNVRSFIEGKVRLCASHPRQQACVALAQPQVIFLTYNASNILDHKSLKKGDRLFEGLTGVSIPIHHGRYCSVEVNVRHNTGHPN